ncbi:hypothetical protein ACFFV8_05500 [Sphingobium indicum]|uniref:transposase n=1 Tax=Sphingobium indicum TaxID=332055 RepID=UPI000F6926C8|nr:transposase [Sphingobium indicum]
MIETVRTSPAIYLGLRKLGVPVFCLDARQAHQSLKDKKADKTDPRDAGGQRSAVGENRFLQGSACQTLGVPGVRSVTTARGHLVEARVRIDNMIPELCATFGYRPGLGQGKALLERTLKVAHISLFDDVIPSLLSMRAERVEQIKEMVQTSRAASLTSRRSNSAK